MILRGRPAGGGRKPPQAAAVKSRGGERLRKRRAVSASGEDQEGERKRTTEDVSKGLDDIETGVGNWLRDEPGGSLLTGQVVSGMKVARAWSGLRCGTWEPVVSAPVGDQWRQSGPAHERADLWTSSRIVVAPRPRAAAVLTVDNPVPRPVHGYPPIR